MSIIIICFSYAACAKFWPREKIWANLWTTNYHFKTRFFWLFFLLGEFFCKANFYMDQFWNIGIFINSQKKLSSRKKWKKFDLKCCWLSAPFSEHSIVMVKMAWLLELNAFMWVDPTLRFLFPAHTKQTFIMLHNYLKRFNFIILSFLNFVNTYSI